jgi:hypothetical protein
MGGKKEDQASARQRNGMHALDVANYVKHHKGSALAELAGHGITYSNARTPANSDSFPGLLALVTGGSPLSHGLFYDVSYNRGIFDPTNTSCQGQPGNMQVFDESIDVYDSNNVSENVIDPAKLPLLPSTRRVSAPSFSAARCRATRFSRSSRPRAGARRGRTKHRRTTS